MKKHTYILTFAVCFLHWCTSPLFAQTGTCEQSTGEAILDAGNVRARILNNGALFWRGSPHVYTVPKDGHSNAIFSSTIWVGGKMDGQIRTSASTYGPWELWPGPLDEQGNPPADCSDYDRLWEIRTEDLERYLNTEEISQNLSNWPWHLGAPVIDGDGNPDNYNLAGGDLPELLGDQRIWWVMNDRGNVHERTDSEPLGIEVRGSASAFSSPIDVVKNTTLYKFTITNRNTLPIEETYFGIYVDPDLGNFDDDFIGSDSLLSLGYVYNSDNEDEGGEGYGLAPPALGYTFLKTPLATTDKKDNDHDGEIDEPGEDLGLTAYACVNKGDYSSYQPHLSMYNCLRGRKPTGDPIYPGDYNSTEGFPTPFYYSGDPLTHSFWSEFNYDGNGNIAGSHDQRFMVSSGPFTIFPDSTQEVVFAIVWSRGADNLDSVRLLKEHTRIMRDARDILLMPVIPAPENFAPLLSRFHLGFDQNFPNPFSQSTTLRYSLPQSMQVKLAVYDMLGRQVDLLVDAQQDAGIYTIEFDAGHLPAGVYLARIELDHLRFTKRMLLIR